MNEGDKKKQEKKEWSRKNTRKEWMKLKKKMNEAEENNWSKGHEKKEEVFSIRTGYSLFTTLCQTNQTLVNTNRNLHYVVTVNGSISLIITIE